MIDESDDELLAPSSQEDVAQDRVDQLVAKLLNPNVRLVLADRPQETPAAAEALPTLPDPPELDPVTTTTTSTSTTTTTSLLPTPLTRSSSALSSSTTSSAPTDEQDTVEEDERDLARTAGTKRASSIEYLYENRAVWSTSDAERRIDALLADDVQLEFEDTDTHDAEDEAFARKYAFQHSQTDYLHDDHDDNAHDATTAASSSSQ